MANAASLNPRERLAVAGAAVVSDLDGLGLVAEILTKHSAHPLLWWSDYHHVLGHNLLFGLAVTLTCAALASRRVVVALLALAAFHSHLIGDLVGGRGPDGDSWPIYYWWPFSRAVPWTFEGQWALNAWPNFVITAIALALTLYLAWRRGYTPLERVCRRADQAVVNALRHRWPCPNPDPAGRG